MAITWQEIRNTGVMIPRICFGTSALGNMPDTYTYEVSERRAVDTISTGAQINTGKSFSVGP